MSHARTTFAALRRPVLFTELGVWADGDLLGWWRGPRGEALAEARLRRFGVESGAFDVHLRVRVVLEDESRVTLAARRIPRELPVLRRLLGELLAGRVESGKPSASEEAHRLLELVEGRALPCLLNPDVPEHLRRIAQGAGVKHLLGFHRRACAACRQVVPHDMVTRRADRHFVDGRLCGREGGHGFRVTLGRRALEELQRRRLAAVMAA